ncbi:MAG: hypothetical protein PVF73_01000 [Bacteroidales bacterium]
MSLKNYFEISRFWLLLKMEIARSRKGLLVTLVITFGFLFFIGLLLTPFIDPSMIIYEHNTGFAFTLLTGGFILSSLAYRDSSNTLRRYKYLTLPVSTFEKFLSMWLLTSFGWILLYTITYTIYSFFANAIGQLLFHDLVFETFNPLGPGAVQFMKLYFVLQGIFLAGAAHFKGYVIPKTLLTLILFGAVCGGITYLLMQDLFHIEMTTESCSFIGLPSFQVWMIIQWLFWWLLAPLCWVITYLGLKEQEV